MRRKREPTDLTGIGVGERIADPTNQRRRVYRPYVCWTRHPTPIAADIRPTSIVRRRKPPWRVIDPGPTPRRYPHPMAVSIRCPVIDQQRRPPDISISGFAVPRAVRIEVPVADDFT